MEQKATTVEIKANQDGTFEGYAAVFGNVDSYGDIIQPGAFTKTIQERRGKIRVLWNHDSFAPPVGKLLDISEDGYGLKIKAQLSSTPRGQEIAQLMRDGVIDSMSIGYSTIRHDYEQRDDLGREVRNLREVKLYEFSPVNFPANEAASITQVKRQHEAEALLTQLDAFLHAELKAGRTLSAASLTRIRAALDSITGATDELTALLEAAEPSGKSHITPGAPAAANPSSEPPKHSPLVLALNAEAQRLARETKTADLLAGLRAAAQRIYAPGGN
ncbi:HK97 family phage prohead protease [Deinococcus daejeonensis]|uniref:Prohead serine protease domain-containing protein n=1 Tax=Deinococcus daejeonensis TaxID=1007098 RepID=A0ABQ2IVJ1_9DEIO|nr:HK97 family phage prohead protease [Deinococcus daejeonensis]GGN32306.1 hypothetical protein GCM10010842_08880 [Deinococcus daejeonensis]